MGDAYFTATYPKARKEHRCEQCQRTIPVGEKYRRQGGVHDGRMYSSVCCLQCAAFADALFKLGFEGDEGGWPWLAEIDGGEVAYVGLSVEYGLFRRKWIGDEGIPVDYPEKVTA